MPQRYDAVVIGGGHNGLVDRRVSGEGRQEGRRPRAPAPAGRGRGLRGDRARLPLQRLLLRRLAAPPGDHPRARAPEARPRDPAAGRDDHAPRRRLPLARERPRTYGPRAPALVAERRRGIRGVRPTDGRDGEVHQADPVDRAAGPREGVDPGLAAAHAAREDLQGPAEAPADHVHPADDDVARPTSSTSGSRRTR